MKKSRKADNKVVKQLKKLGKVCKKHKVVTTLVLMATCMGIVGVDTACYEANRPEGVDYSVFTKQLEAGEIDTVYYSSGEEYMRYTLLNDETREMTKKERQEYKYADDEWRETLYPSGETFREDMLSAGVNLVVKDFSPKSEAFLSVLISIAVPIGLIYLLCKLLMRGTSVKNAHIEYSDVNAKPVMFSDVIGHDEIIKDLKYIVSMMKDRSILKKFDMQVPKGILFSGDPGTGKTLLAKAIAGESGVPFLYLNASKCIEVFAGTGAKRVRGIFQQARKLAPCIVFIDEIDAIGGNRDNAHTGSEYIQTTNALLQEMDGFDTESGVFVIGATNNPDTLDKALLRSGRFDRQVVVPPPKDWKERKLMFEHYLKGVSNTADLELISKQCVGFTGADINTVVNEAKLIASMANSDKITTDNIEEAIDKRIFKGNRSKRDERNKDDLLVAYHEAGHAVVTYLCEKPIARATIVSTTSGVGGFVMQTDEDRRFTTKSDLEKQLLICYAGRCSERIKFNEVTIGADSDIMQATEIIQQYVLLHGFSEEFGMLNITNIFRNGCFPKQVVELMADMAKRYEGYSEDLLRKNYDKVEKVAQELLKRETLSSEAILEILN